MDSEPVSLLHLLIRSYHWNAGVSGIVLLFVTEFGFLAATTQYCSIDAATATQLLINTPGFPSLGTLEARVDAPSGHWNPECAGRGKGHRPENRQRAPTQGTALSLSGIPSGVVGGFSAAWFMAKPLMEVTTSLVGACCLQVQFWSPFPETPATHIWTLSPNGCNRRRSSVKMGGHRTV